MHYLIVLSWWLMKSIECNGKISYVMLVLSLICDPSSSWVQNSVPFTLSLDNIAKTGGYFSGILE